MYIKRNLDDGLHRDLISGTWTLSIAGHVMSVILPCGFVIMLIFLLAMCVNKEKERAKMRAEIEAEIAMKHASIPVSLNPIMANIQEKTQSQRRSSLLVSGTGEVTPSATPAPGNTSSKSSVGDPPETFVNMIKNAKMIVKLAVDTVAEISKTEDPITSDLRSVAELHLAEIAEAWQGITAAEDLNDLILFANFIESKCAIINDLHNTYNTYTAIKLSMGAGAAVPNSSSGSNLNAKSSKIRRGIGLASNEEMTIDEEDEHGLSTSASASARAIGSRGSATIRTSGSAASITKRHKSRLKKITEKLKSQEDGDPKYQSTAYWTKKVDKMLEKREHGSFSKGSTSKGVLDDDYV